MEADFTPAPHKEAVALITGKPVVVKRVFNQLLPEIKARAFTVAGIESANAMQRIRDAVASVPLGAQGGQTWDQAKRMIVDELDPYLGDGAARRAEMVLRVNTFQAYSASIHEVGMADEDTTHFQYLHGECEVPTPSHLALNGIILPKDDVFWDTHTGPWGHLGCVCYKRPMNIDQVDAEKAKDEKRNPDNQMVLEGPALEQLNHGTLIRDGRRHDTNIDGPDNSGFKWSPGDFKIPLADLEKKYDPEVWGEFQAFAQSTPLDEKRSVWDWLNGPAVKKEIPAAPAVQKSAKGKTAIAAGIAMLADKFKTAKFSAKMIEHIKALPPAVAPLLENLSIESSGRKSAFYRRSEKTIFLKRNIADWSGHPDTMIHEVGHHLHYETGTVTNTHVAPEFQLAVADDWKNFQAWAEKKIGEDWKEKLSGNIYDKIDTIKEALGYQGDWQKLSLGDQKRIGRFGDTIMGLSGGRYGFGHDRSYMVANGLKEVFTHAWTGLVDSDAEYSSLFNGVTTEVRRVLNL